MSVPPVIQYCKSCQKKIPTGAAFCASCGVPVQATPKNNSNAPLMIGIVGAVVIACAIVLLALNNKTGVISQGSSGGSAATIAAPTPAPTPTPIPWPEDATPIVRVTLDEFGSRYDDNKIFVKTTYGGKFIALQGQVESINGNLDSGTMLLRGMTTNAAVTCTFNSRTTPQLARVRKGLVVVVRGYFDGGEGQPLATDRLEMRDCKIEDQ